MNKDLKDIVPMLLKALGWIKKHRAVLTMVIIGGMYGFLILQINLLSLQQPDETAVQEQIKTIRRPNISKDAAEKLRSLEDNSEETKALFQAARDNPFLE